MRRTLYYIMVAMVVMATIVLPTMAAGPYAISGYIPGVSDSLRVQLRNIERENPKVLHEIFTTDGHFNFSDTISMPTLCDIAVTKRSKDGNFYRAQITPRVMIEEGAIDIAFAQPIDSFVKCYIPERMVKVCGSDSHSQLLEFIGECGGAEENWRRAHDLYVDKWFETHNNKDSMPKYEEADKAAKAVYDCATREFIKAHPAFHISSVLTMKELINTYVYTEKELEAMHAMVSVCPDTARISLNKRAYDWGRKYALQMKYPDFEVNDTLGVTKSMSECLKEGKYTFLDFWASWCGPCRASIPHVKEIRKKFGDKIQFYSISIDKEEDNWRTAMREENMEWQQLHLTEAQTKNVINLYCLNSIPRLMLLDPEGRIICSTYLPEEMDECLTRTFK